MSEVIVAVSGYFDPFHVGHLEQITLAKELGNKLVVIVNNDHQAFLKNGRSSFMSQEDRVKIMEALEAVDEVFLSIDTDRSVCRSLEAVNPNIFAKGGDRHSGEIPEGEVCKRLNIKIVDGLGKKIRASSDIRASIRGQQDG